MLRRIAFSVVVALLGACAADRSGLAGRGQDDGGRDGGLDGSIARDAGFDGSIEGDAGVDGGSDAGTDTGVDSGTDSGTDAGVDSGTDAGVDSGTDAGVDSGTDSNEARCRARFGDAPGFEYCGSAEDRCEHYVRFAPPDNNCAGVCDRRGATCLGSFDNGAPNCMRSRPVDCGGNFIDRICICSLPD